MNTPPISRRTVLRGLGTAMALPLFEVMQPARRLLANQPSKPPVRMANLFVPNGINLAHWTPEEVGALGELPAILAPLEKHKQSFNVLTGLALEGGRAQGDGPGDHARCVASYLTGAHPYKTDGKGIRNGISVDQAAAKAIGDNTRFPSLELGCEPSSQGGRCDSGYSCIYTSNMSWRTATSPMSKEINPQDLFDRLFGNDSRGELKSSRAKRNRQRKSILDLVSEDARSLQRSLGKADTQKLDEYLYAVRQIERRVEDSEKLLDTEVGVPDFPRPAGVPKEFDAHVRMMMDMMVLAFQTDSTRVSTFMYTNAGSNRNYPDIDVPDGHHSISHHGNNKEKLEKIARINTKHVTHLAYFLDQLSAVKEGDGTLLDNCMITYGSGIGDGNRHNHHDLPILLAGGGGGTIQTGRHIKYETGTPLTNLYLGMLQRLGAQTSQFSDSKRPLGQLTG